MKFKKFLNIRKFGLLHFIIPVVAVVIPTAVILTQIPNPLLGAFRFNKPKPIIASTTKLPENIQQAIQNLAAEEIKQDQAKENLPFNTTSLEVNTGGEFIRNQVLNIQELVTTNPSDKAKIKIKEIDILIGRLQDLLDYQKDEKATDRAVTLIAEIGSLTDGIVKDPNLQTDRGVLQFLIEQYNRLQLILQRLEDTLPIASYQKVEDARQKYLVVTAMASINNAPNLDAVHNIALKEVEKVVGKDFSELKAIEIISDFEEGVKPEAREKLSGLEKQLAVDFEKRMLKLPKDVRERKLQDFIKYSFGNPIRQVQSFERMKSIISNKEIASGVDNLKMLALQKVKSRISEANSEDKIQNLLGSEKALGDEAKKLPEIKLTKEQEQALYEKIQQITQNIFLTADGQKSDLEKKLPEEIQNQIQKLKTELTARNVPKIETPVGVILSEVAKLPDEVENAILAAAKRQIEDENRPKEVELDLSLQAKDLGVSDPIILPGNPLYIVREVIRTLELVITLDPIAKAEALISQDNEKTLEAAKLLEQSEDTQTIDLALDTLKDVQSDFERLKEHTSELNQLSQTQPEKVDQLVDQIIENGVARQTVLASIEDKVYGDSYVEVEKVRSDILQDGVDTLLKLTDNNVQSLTDKLEKAVEEVSGSDLAQFKGVELLTEIKKDQPEDFQPILENSIDSLAQKLEDQLLALPEEQRIEKVLDYIDASPGNPVIQFEAADELKSHFDDPQLIELTEGIKDKAVENLTDLISEITDGTSKHDFVDIVVGNRIDDLKIITDIEIRMTPPQTDVALGTTPIVEQVQDIKSEVEQNIIETYKDNPTELVQDLTKEEEHVTDILDVKTVSEIVDVLTRSPEVVPEVVKEAQKLEGEVIDNFVGDVSANTNQALTPVPEVIEQLVELRNETPAAVDIKIDIAIEAEVELIQKHLTSEVNDPKTFENYVAQIEENPIVEKVITSIGGSEFTQAEQQKAAEIEVAATSEQTTLTETVKQIEQEIFSAPLNQPSEVEQTLPQTVQEQIQEVKQEVPVEQVPAVTVETQPAPTSEPVPATSEVEPAEPVIAPAVPGL